MMATFSDYLFYGAYCSQGLGILVANGLLLATISFEHSLRKRKEMLIIAGMAGVDVFYGLGATMMAIYRIVLLSLGEQNNLISDWDCMMSPYTLLQLGTQLTSIVNVVVSCDRLMAVARPIKYRILTTRYAGWMLALIALFGLSSLAAMLLSAYFGTSREPRITKMCSVPAYGHAYGLYHSAVISVPGILSVAIYIGVFVAYRRTMNSIAPHDGDQQIAIAQQRRLAVTLGIITLSTLFFFVIPYTFLAVCAWANIAFPPTAVIGMVSRLSTINNVAIYVYRQKEVRSGMWGLVTCKKKTTTTRTVAMSMM